MFQSAQDVFGSLRVARRLTQQEHGERGGFGPLGDVDQLLQTRHAQRDVFGRHAGVVESVQCHLGGGLSQRLSSQSTHHFTRVGLEEEEEETGTFCF